MFKLAILLLQVTQQVLGYIERSRLIAEGERRQLAKELAMVAKTAAIAVEIKEEVGKLSDEEVDAALRGYFRP